MKGGDYWTGTASDARTEVSLPSAIQMSFGYEGSELTLIPNGRHDGLCVRPVISRQDIGTSVATIDNDAMTMTYENGTLTVNGHVPEYRLTVADLSGRRVIDSPVNDGKCRLSHLPKGIYLASLHNAGKTVKTLKISVK